MRRITRLLTLVLPLAGCGGRETAPPPVTAPVADCKQDLAAAGAVFEPIAIGAASAAQGCTLVEGVKVSRTTLALNRPVELTCPTALRWMRYERDVLQPAARRLFGLDLTTVNHAGGFTCRAMTGNGKRLSEHGRGQALDVWGYVLQNGQRISVAQDWRRTDARGAFLRQTARQGCGVWSVVLSPDSDADHQDHIHFDIGAQRLCAR